LTTTQRIEAFNAGREPERLGLKFDIMRTSAFSFLRATCHLFYEDLDYAAIPAAPLTWCSGDLHLQNFGTYKGDNRLTYFDINDFDEACLAPATWDLVRFLTSIIVAGNTIDLRPRIIDALLDAFLAGYTAALAKGKPSFLERETSTGLIHNLLAKLAKRDRSKFLDSRTIHTKGKRRLRLDGERALPLLPGELDLLRDFTAVFAATQPRPDFFDFLDGARRIAGTSSLGLPRYVLLVKGRGGDDENFLLDLKFHAPSVVTKKHPIPQPAFPTEAHRVAWVQTIVQAADPALFTPVTMDNRGWILRELMPTADRLEIEHAHKDADEFTDLLHTLGQIVAWGNLRAAAHKGAASPDELIDFARRKDWREPLLQSAVVCAERTEQQYLDFRAVKSPCVMK
jgi:uncharacterized protein (DUF2252 family)